LAALRKHFYSTFQRETDPSLCPTAAYREKSSLTNVEKVVAGDF